MGGVAVVKLTDIQHGPDWVIWVAFAILAILSAILISGHGSGLISGYNVASKEEKEKFDEKKLCRTTGTGMAVIAVLILVTGLFKDRLPTSFVYVLIGIIVVDVIIILILGNTICRK